MVKATVTRNFGPRPIDRSEAASSARPSRHRPGRHFGAQSYARPLAGLATFVVIGVIVAISMGLFQGSFTDTVPVTVVSPRAGLVMNPEAKVKMRGVEVGKVGSIDVRPERPSRPAPRDAAVANASHSGQCARRHRVDHGFRCQIRRVGTTCRSSRTEPAARCQVLQGKQRHGGDQHGIPATDVGAVDDRSGQTQRDPRCDRGGGERSGPQDRPDAFRSGRVSGQAGSGIFPR